MKLIEIAIKAANAVPDVYPHLSGEIRIKMLRPEAYKSEDFFLSRMYDPKKFKIVNHYFGQDSRRFKKMGYFGMAWYLIKNFINRNNQKYWDRMDNNKYWS